ncbi:diguanylate cyclase (GGDEF)-like protein/PAS domain S-box-containing protein [Sphingobium fontiphilum]|uniref:Diguanylate cyclase (GGDEF)-like protein/PAS domain S-box-containing protein n=1 Tax=Sphingobium fontiphilum TaxID=944425 RepID=A0A7W6DKP3_9SPHN|nr:EAL domain-containing protein [Sphingobium fontiphilum]MBB3980819.1 diguanylate cyclase (GGDEF)-like protein/PAS domain S-box-containing protein [Sphingobium fontiphilum]
MLDILWCIRDDHDIRLVLLAAAVCLLSTMTAVLMLRQANRATGQAARNWAVTGALATGFGIWSTHFIAMLGYDPGIIAGYHLGLTVSSLAIVLIATIMAFLIATRDSGRFALGSGAVIAALGFSAMHYVGMSALAMPAAIQWRPAYVILSLLLAVMPFYPAMRIALRRRSTLSGVMAGLMMTAAIVGLHFSGMTAIRLLPARMEDGAAMLSPHSMSVLIGATSFVVLALCLIGWAIARRTRAAIAASERELSILVKGVSDCAIYMLDSNGRIANWNAGAQRLKGYRIEEVVGQPLANFYTPEDREAGTPARALRIAHDSGKFTGEGWRVRKDGSRFWAHVTIERIHDEAGAHLGYAKITRDMTRFKEDQDRLEEARRHLDAALEHMHQGLCLFGADERLVLRNHRFVELWGLPDDSCLPGATLMDIARAALEQRAGTAVPQERLDNMRALLRQSLDDPDMPPVVSEFGDSFVISISSRPLPDGGWVTTFEDITERRRSEAKIAHMALHDDLTGLPNRTSFNRWLDKEIDHAVTRGEHVAMIAIDLDRFKEVNDAQGHAAGDLVLQRVADALSGMTEDGECVARIGGDEFAAAKHFAEPADLQDFVARVDACFAAQLGAQDGIAVGASLGIALFPEDASGREMLLNNADLAMYRAKGSLSEHICYYEPGMDESARMRRQLANDLRQAVARGEMTMLYQPQRSLKTNDVSGYEALIRWRHPRLGVVSPADFIPIAEENGEIMRLGEWVLRTACQEAARWPRPDRIAVNLSAVQLLQPELPDIVMRILLETGLSPSRLELEITETAIISDKVRALHSLRRIKALGVLVAMDDFGTGYSSLDTLHSFPFDKIKIDKSFLLESDRSEQARAIIRAVLALGRSLAIPVLAEGVETQTQLDLLVREGCDEAQGYYFGRPAQAPSAIAPPSTSAAA